MPCDPCGVLPSELKQLILAQLDLYDIARCARVSRAWQRDTTPLHALARSALHAGIVPPRGIACAQLTASDGEQCARLLGLASVHGHYKGLPTFEALCMRQRAIAEAWAARGAAPQPVFTCVLPSDSAHPDLADLTATQTDEFEPWRIKLDSEEGTLLFTTRHSNSNALHVVSVPPVASSTAPVPLAAEIGVHLWTLDDLPIRTHIEADEGYVVFWQGVDHASGRDHFVVFRRECDVGAAELGRAPVRGAYRQTSTWAVPREERDDHTSALAFRLCYPTLAVTQSRKRVALIDVRVSAEAVSLEPSSAEQCGGHACMTYVDHSPEHVFMTAFDSQRALVTPPEEPIRTFDSGFMLMRRSDGAAWTIGQIGTTVPVENVVLRRLQRGSDSETTPHFFEAADLGPPEQVTLDEIVSSRPLGLLDC